MDLRYVSFNAKTNKRDQIQSSVFTLSKRRLGMVSPRKRGWGGVRRIRRIETDGVLPSPAISLLARLPTLPVASLGGWVNVYGGDQQEVSNISGFFITIFSWMMSGLFNLTAIRCENEAAHLLPTRTYGICLWLGVFVIVLNGVFGAIPWINEHLIQWENLPSSNDLPLGSEYFFIGKSLSEGRGFTSPFRIDSGPTAWMPPGLPVLIGTLYTITGHSQFWTAVLFHSLGIGCVALAWRYILRFSVQAGINLIFSTIGLFVCIYAQWQDIFRSTHDSPFLILMTAWVLASCLTIWKQYSSSPPISLSTMHWGGLGGLLSFLSPALLLAWLLCTVMMYFQRRKHLVLAILVMFMIQSPWIIRNYLRFGQLIPIKSNAAFEAALASKTPTGVLTPVSFEGHPYVDEQEAIRHAELGEIEYIRVRAAEMRASQETLPTWLYQVVQRAAAYFAVSTSWMSSRGQAFCYGVPFFLCMLHLALGKFNRLPMACVLAVWFGYGAVYILVSYYERYSAPMVPVRCLCVALGLQSLWKSREGVGGLWHRSSR